MNSETTDEVITVAWLLSAPVVWAGKGAYHTAQRMGMRYQNWKYGEAGEDGSSAPATTSGGAGKEGKWATIETSETTDITYHHASSTKWSR